MKATLFSATIAMMILVSNAQAQRTTFDDVVKKVEAKIEPALAKRGETVKWTLSFQLASGWHTYPTRQPDEKHEAFVNKMKFANAESAVFVGELKEPAMKLVLEDGAQLAEIEGSPVWERTLLIRPDAKPGKVKISVPASIQVCNASGCLPPKKLTLEVELTISDAPASRVDPKYQKELDAGGKK